MLSKRISFYLLILSSVFTHSTGFEAGENKALENKTEQIGICGGGGNFYKTNLFKDKKKMTEFFKENVEVSALFTDSFCANPIYSFIGMLGIDISKNSCACDCKYTHGATGPSQACTNAAQVGIGPSSQNVICHCPYNPSDLTKFSCKKKQEQPAKPDVQKDVVQVKVQKTTKDASPIGLECIPGQGPLMEELCRDNICNSLLAGKNSFICDMEKLFGGNLQTHFELDGHKIFPVDVCAIDCHLVHGATKEPFGECLFHEEHNVEYCYCHV